MIPAWKTQKDFPEDVFKSFIHEVILLGIDWATGTAYHAVALQTEKSSSSGELLFPAEDHKFLELRRAFATLTLSPKEFVTVAHARHLVEWASKCRFCGRCGSPTVAYYGGWKRKCSNVASKGPDNKPECGIPHYPRIDPVVISGVVSKKTGKFLLIHGAKFPEGMHSVVSGFMNPGETIEEAVRREVKEETGVTVGKVVYVSSQPWPFAGEIMIGCMGISEEDDIEVDGTEIASAVWVTADEVSEALKAGIAASSSFWTSKEFRIPPPFAIAHHICKSFVANPKSLL